MYSKSFYQRSAVSNLNGYRILFSFSIPFRNSSSNPLRNKRLENEQGFLMIELLVALLLISIVFLGVEKLLLYNCTLEQQTEWIYQATLSGRNGLTSYPLSREVVLEKPDKDIFLEKSDLVKSQAWLAETFPNSKIVLEKAGKKIKVRCLPPPGSQFKIIELEE